MAQWIEGLQNQTRSGFVFVMLTSAKVFVSLMVGLTLALIGDEVFRNGWLAFVLMVVATMTVLLRIMKSWNFGHVAVFTVICVLIGVSLSMYIHVAPG